MTQDNDPGVRNWAMLCHLSSLFWILIALFLGIFSIPLPIPLLNILGPLVVWLSKKNQHPVIDAHGKESLNFQISCTIYSAIAAIIFLFLISVTCGVGFGSSHSPSPSQSLQSIGLLLGIGGIALALIVGILQLILVIFAAVKAKNGEFYHYPLTIRFLR